MKLRGKIEFGVTTLLEFSGPDTVRFLNGQLTQDVRKVVGSGTCIPSCITDAKGKLQFRVWLCEAAEGAIWISALGDIAGDLEARLTRYLIADDVEVRNRSAEFSLIHLLEIEPGRVKERVVRKCERFGVSGIDCWVPTSAAVQDFAQIESVQDDLLEDFRISKGVPAWGKELQAGMLPPEAALEPTDISYVKGCYIGHEVICRIKSAGKVNRSLSRFSVPQDLPLADEYPIYNGDRVVGELTSVSPLIHDGSRFGLGYLKRVADAGELSLRGDDDVSRPVSLL